MSIIEAIVLACIQALTEFLPVSSSAHLLAIPKLLNLPSHVLAFDTLLHFATAFSIIIYFRKVLSGILKRLKDNLLLVKLFIMALVPTLMMAFILNNIIDEKFHNQDALLAVGIIMLISTIYFIFSEYKYRKTKLLAKNNLITPDIVEQITVIQPWQALLIGSSQILALLPGVSRSGIMIATGQLLGINREILANFSFLAGLPIFILAGLSGISTLVGEQSNISVGVLILAFLSTLILGYFVISWMLKIIKKFGLLPFIIYRFVFALLLIWYGLSN